MYLGKFLRKKNCNYRNCRSTHLIIIKNVHHILMEDQSLRTHVNFFIQWEHVLSVIWLTKGNPNQSQSSLIFCVYGKNGTVQSYLLSVQSLISHSGAVVRRQTVITWINFFIPIIITQMQFWGTMAVYKRAQATCGHRSSTAS